MGQAYGIGGLISVPPGAVTGRGPPPASFKGQLGQQYFDVSTSPPTQYVYNGQSWQIGGDPDATTTSFGVVQLATLTELQNGNAPAGAYVPTSNDVATVIAGIVVGAVPPANESQAGIAEIATQAETNAGLDDTRIVSPLKLATYISGGGAGAGSFTDLTATGTVTFTGVTGALSMTSTSASTLNVTGAGIDLTLDSASGQLILTGGEAAINAVRIQADNAAGGIDADAGTGGITIDTTGAISIDSAATSNFTVTGAGADLNLGSVLGSVLVSATEDAALAIRLHANGGTSETIQIHSDQGTGVASIGLLSDVGGLTLRATGLASNDAINLEAAAGGIDMDAALQINIRTTQSAADSLVIESTLGGIDILASGASAGEDIDIIATGSSINITSTENAAEAIYLRTNGGVSETLRLHADQGTGVASINIGSDVGGITIAGGLGTADAVNITASTAGGGIDIDSSTGGFDLLTTGAISLDASLASNLTVTGASVDLTLSSSGGSVVITGTEAAVDAVQINGTTALGGIDINAGTGGITIDSTGAFSIDGAAASNVTTTGAGIDLTLSSVLGSVLVSSTEDAALAIRLHANGGVSETIQLHADQGTGVGSVNLLSDVGGITLRATGLATADAINLEAPAGGIDMDSALLMSLTSTRDNAQAILIEATVGGIDILASGAAAGEDIDIIATGSSVNITSTEAAANSIVLTASNAAGGIDLTTGGGSIDLSSTGFVTVVANTASVASPTASSTQNFNVGAATFTGFTTASAASQVFTITNSIVTTSSVILVTVCNEGANDAQMTKMRVKRSAGAFEVTTKNNGAAALNGNVTVSWWILQA